MGNFYRNKPSGFVPVTSVATCFIKCKESLLFLKRAHREIAPNTWAIPGGKLEKGESPEDAVIREVYEETNIKLINSKLEFSGEFYVRHVIMDYKLYIYKYYLTNFPKNLKINAVEHSEYIWKSIESIQDLELIDGQLEAFYLAYQDC